MKTLKYFAISAITAATILSSCSKSNSEVSNQTDSTSVFDTINVPAESTMIAPAESTLNVLADSNSSTAPALK